MSEVVMTNTPRVGDVDCKHGVNTRYRCLQCRPVTNSEDIIAVGTSEKPSNPKDALGVKKVPMSCVPAPVIAELAVAMLEGALKYGRHNYRVIGVRGSVYYDATMRHLMDYWEGVDIDPDSGLSHITKAIASLTVLRDAMMQGTYTDDRPPRATTPWLAELNKRVEALLEKYPTPVAAYTQVDKGWADEANKS